MERRYFYKNSNQTEDVTEFTTFCLGYLDAVSPPELTEQGEAHLIAEHEADVHLREETPKRNKTGIAR